MALFTIKEGKHRATPIRLGLYLNKSRIAYKVVFDKTAKYEIVGEDQFDISKLFGIGYFPNHHKESARFGWRYNGDINRIEIFAYCYINGERITSLITTLFLDRIYPLILEITEDSYRFTVIRDSVHYTTQVSRGSKKRLGYKLSPYFGGNQPAQKTIKIEMKKI